MSENMENRRVKHVVVDAIAFFKNVQLQELAENVYTSYGVVNEIRDAATRQRLSVLPYDLKCREPSTEAILAVSEFARKTGDYASLSAVDIRVLALAYQVTKEETGEEPHFKQADDKVPLSDQSLGNKGGVVGFVYPKEKDNKSDKEDSKLTNTDKELSDELSQLNTGDDDESTGDVELTLTELEAHQTKTSETQAPKSNLESNSSTEEIAHIENSSTNSETRTSEKQNVESCQKDVKLSDVVNENKCKETDDFKDEGVDTEDQEVVTEDSEEDEEEDEDEGWIKPSNLQQMQKDMGGLDEEVDDIVVGCMTTDYAMQNVLIQIGIPVLSVEGMRIRRAKNFIMRCYGCFKTTSNTNKRFCPGCGNATLTKVSVSVDENTGTQHLHFSKRKVINTKGMKYSLPMPKGGKHADNPFLVADQPMPQNRIPRKARVGTDVFDPDFLANASPFAMKDVTSRSAQLGVGHLSSNTSRHRRNPNAGGRKKGKKK